jgi:hypothetical protein
VKVKLSMNHGMFDREWNILRRLSDKYPRSFIKTYDHVFGNHSQIDFQDSNHYDFNIVHYSGMIMEVGQIDGFQTIEYYCSCYE